MDLSDLDCPQYVCFESLIKNDSLKDMENIPPSHSCSQDATVNMDIEDELQSNASLVQDVSHSGSVNSTFSESYLAHSSYQDSIGPLSEQSELSVNKFPVMRSKNLSLTENPSKKHSKLKTTKVQPFNLTEAKKRKREDEHVPMAEQIIAFHKKTPERFHTTGPKDFQPTKHWSPPILNPKSPNLQAAKRKRPINVLSREEEEAKEVEEMKRYRFRARPIKHSTLHRPNTPKKTKKSATKPRDFNLRTAQRAAETYAKSISEESSYEFHARPVPKSILSGTTGLKEKQKIPATQAKTPNFALKKRAEKWKSENKLNELANETQVFKAMPVPVSSVPFAVKHQKKCTEIQPFSFDDKDKERMAQKDQKIIEEIEKESAVYVFKAQRMPCPAPSSLPAVSKKPVTQPEPFNFHFDETSSKHSFNSTMEQQCPNFKAQPANVLKKAPFVPEKSAKPAVEIQEFQLHTDARASERLKLKEINAVKEHEKELALQRLKELEEEEERKEIMRLRKEAVHKANPVRHYKPVEIKPSGKPPTMPVSPKFKTDERRQAKH